MAKLTKKQTAEHNEAMDILNEVLNGSKEKLSIDDRLFVYDNYREDANHATGQAGAFFTPNGLARDFNLAIPGHRIIDLCAGIGKLGFFHWLDCHGPVTCVELNPDYVRIGKALFPEATWIQGDVFDMVKQLKAEGKFFDAAISNPPFGKPITRPTGDDIPALAMEYQIAYLGGLIADEGVFIMPQDSTPFRYSFDPQKGPHIGENRITDDSKDKTYSPSKPVTCEKYAKFTEKTGYRMELAVGIDTGQYLNEWHGVSPLCEVVQIDYVNSNEEP